MIGHERGRSAKLGTLLHLERRLDEGQSKTGLQVPFDVACDRLVSKRSTKRRRKTYSAGATRQGCLMIRVISRQGQEHREVSLPAMNLRRTEPPDATCTVSRRMGFAWPSTRGGLSSGSSDK
jgi:hypothetical protein